MSSSDDTQVSQFLGQDNVAPDANADETAEFLENTFIPELQCSEANNGILRVSILNKDKLYDHWDRIMIHQTKPASYPCFRLKFKCHYRQKQDSKWKEVDIFIGNINDVEDDCYFYLLVNAQLEAYKFIFKLHVRSLRTNDLMPPSKPMTVIIPSFVMDITYLENEAVEFRKNGESQPRDAKILQVLPDNMYKLEYDEFIYDEDDDTNDPYTLPKIESKVTTVHLDRLYKLSIDNQFVTRIHSPEHLENTLFVKRHDKKSQQIWRALEDHYDAAAVLFCYEMYDEDEVLVHHKPISYFVTKHIFEFLYEPHFEWRLKCFVNDRDGYLKMMNVRTNNIRRMNLDFQYLNDPEFKIPSFAFDHDDDSEDEEMLQEDRFDDIKVGCDWCCVDISEWEYYFSCEASRSDKHDYCVNCVATVIRLNKALKTVLRKILDEELIVEIVDCIADFTLGSVIEKGDEREEDGERKVWESLSGQRRHQRTWDASDKQPKKQCRLKEGCCR